MCHCAGASGLCGIFRPVAYGGDMLASHFQMVLNLRTSPEAAQRSLRLDLCAVLHDALQSNQASMQQHAQHLSKQFIQRLLVLHTKLRKRMIVDPTQTCKPLQGRINIDLSRQFPRRPDPATVAVQSYTNQQPRIETTSARESTKMVCACGPQRRVRAVPLRTGNK